MYFPFLAEAPEFQAGLLDSLRQSLESGKAEVHRARMRATLPARVQLVLAANPCPCGYAYSVDAPTPCICSPAQRSRYLGRLSGPLVDRIDLRLTLRRVSSVLIDADEAPRPSSAELKGRVIAARARAAERLQHTPWRVNSEVPSSWLHGEEGRLPRSATAVLDQAYARASITLRGYDRILRLAWTLSDLADKERPGRSEIARALALREGAAL